jgi:hypothetical protein
MIYYTKFLKSSGCEGGSYNGWWILLSLFGRKNNNNNIIINFLFQNNNNLIIILIRILYDVCVSLYLNKKLLSFRFEVKLKKKKFSI